MVSGNVQEAATAENKEWEEDIMPSGEALSSLSMFEPAPAPSTPEEEAFAADPRSYLNMPWLQDALQKVEKELSQEEVDKRNEAEAKEFVEQQQAMVKRIQGVIEDTEKEESDPYLTQHMPISLAGVPIPPGTDLEELAVRHCPRHSFSCLLNFCPPPLPYMFVCLLMVVVLWDVDGGYRNVENGDAPCPLRQPRPTTGCASGRGASPFCLGL